MNFLREELNEKFEKGTLSAIELAIWWYDNEESAERTKAVNEALEELAKIIKENEDLKQGIKEAVEFIDSTHFWEVNSYNTGEYYMRCRYCLNDYKHGGHHKECVVGMWLERWGE